MPWKCFRLRAVIGCETTPNDLLYSRAPASGVTWLSGQSLLLHPDVMILELGFDLFVEVAVVELIGCLGCG